jgi:signal transduction histidine kinase
VDELFLPLYGCGEKELVGCCRVEDIFTEAERGRLAEMIDRSMNERVILENNTANILTRKNLTVPVVIDCVPVADSPGRSTGGYLIIDELNRLKEAIVELDRLKVELESIVRDRTRELRIANDGLQQLNEELTQTNEELKQANDELLRMQENMLRQEKLATIGKMAGSVCHELRNPLATIKNISYYLSRRVKTEDEKVLEFLLLLGKEVTSASSILEQLIDFTRIKRLAPGPVSVDALIADSLNAVSVPERVKVTLQIPPDLGAIEADPEKLKHAFTNIIRNAVQSIAAEGALEIRAGMQGAQVGITFADTGSGMTHDVLSRMFDPLFSTKLKGMGLGLVIVKEIVEMHNGTIKVESEPGKGTVMTVQLPPGQGKGT